MIGDPLLSHLAQGALILALAALGLIIVQFASKRAIERLQSSDRMPDERRQQVITLAHVIRWGANVLILATAVLMLLSTFGVDISPLLASAGVTALAVSLGAQSLLKDFIGGLLILIENQYAVGDVIEVGSVSGSVEEITLRTTHVRGLNGNLYIVPNGEVRIVANQTKEWSRAVVDLGVAYEEDLDRALGVLQESAEAFAREPELGSQLLEPPNVVGPISLGDWAITVRVTAKTRPGKQWEIGRQLQRFLLAACEREGISLPYPRQEVWVRNLAVEAAGPDDK
jgi:small-conductance mechanosensitive channel